VTDAVAHRLERLVRELTADRHDIDPPDHEMRALLRRELDDVRLSMARADSLRLEVLIDRLTGAQR
jgi:hypothetical protein